MSKESKQLTDQYYGLACPDQACIEQDNPQGLGRPKWLGKLLGAIAVVVGSAVGGPIGGAIGAAIAGWLKENWRVSSIEVEGEVNSDEYPLTSGEEKYLIGWFQNNFAKTINTLADLIDLQIINNQISKSTISVSNDIVNAANRVLKAVSVIRANNETLEKYKERIGVTSGITFYRSFNFTYNKVRLSNMLLDALEKGVFDYMEKHALDHKLVIEQETVSNINQIEQTTLDWQGKTVTANVKKYVSETIPTKPNQVEVVVTNTDPLDPRPSTNEEVVTTTTPVITDSQRGNSKYMKWLAWAGIGFVAYKVISHKKSK